MTESVSFVYLEKQKKKREVERWWGEGQGGGFFTLNLLTASDVFNIVFVKLLYYKFLIYFRNDSFSTKYSINIISQIIIVIQ